MSLFDKPVLPMVMRGVPAPAPKGRYIVFDTKREGGAASPERASV